MIPAIVLAAGEAKRFGGCKQLALIGGKPLLQHVLDTVRRSSVSNIIVVLGSRAGEIRAAIAFENVRVVINERFADGMSTSLRAGIDAARDANAAVIVLGDQPFVTSDTIDRLIREYARSRAEVVIPTFEGRRGNPVLIDRALFPEIMKLRGDIGARAVFDRHKDAVRELAVNDRGVVTDVDTAADLQC